MGRRRQSTPRKKAIQKEHNYAAYRDRSGINPSQESEGSDNEADRELSQHGEKVADVHNTSLSSEGSAEGHISIDEEIDHIVGSLSPIRSSRISSDTQLILDSINDFKKSTEERFNELKLQIRGEIKVNSDAITELKNENTELKTRLLNMERYSKSYNLLLNGVKEGDEEDDCTNFVKQLLKSKLQLHGSVEMAHRLGPKRGRPRPIVIKFIYRQERTAVLKKSKTVLKGSTMYFREHLTKEDREARQSLKDVANKAYQNKKKVVWKNGSDLFIDGRKHSPMP